MPGQNLPSMSAYALNSSLFRILDDELALPSDAAHNSKKTEKVFFSRSFRNDSNIAIVGLDTLREWSEEEKAPSGVN